jgi:hypothetical protein
MQKSTVFKQITAQSKEKKNILTSVPETGFRLIQVRHWAGAERDRGTTNLDYYNLSEQCCQKFGNSSITVARQKKFV